MFKTILTTFTTTAGALILSAHLFLSSFLGMLGLAATSVGAPATLQASQRIVDPMKARHARKQTRITKRFIKRSGRRVTSTALAAATAGTVAVVAAMTAIEISHYCDEKRALQEDANVLYGTNTKFHLDRCLDESADDAKAIIAEATDTVTAKVSDALDYTQQFSKELRADIKAATNSAIDYTNSALANLWNSMASWFTE